MHEPEVPYHGVYEEALVKLQRKVLIDCTSDFIVDYKQEDKWFNEPPIVVDPRCARQIENRIYPG